MNSNKPNHYEQLKLLLSSYVSSMKYSNSNSFNTFTIFSSVQNMTSVDDYYIAGLQSLSLVLMTLTLILSLL